MLPTKAALSKLLAVLYDAASDASPWSMFLEELAQKTQSSQAAILLHDLRHQHGGISLQWGIDSAAIQSYGDYFQARDHWLRKAAPLVHTGWSAISQEICSFEQLSRTEFYNDYLKPNSMAHAMWGVMEKSPSRMINVGLYRDLRGPFGTDDLELLRFVTPHIVRAFRLHLLVSELKAQAAGLQHAIDCLTTGLILLGERGRIVYTNHRADQLLAEGDGLKVAHGYLRAERSAEASALDHLISQAEATSNGKGFGSGGALNVSRRTKPPLQVWVSPLGNVSLDSITPTRVIVFVSDRSQASRPASNILSSLFRLTPAEIRVALLLSDGHTPKEISDLIGVSVNTLKTQIRSIYRKTGTSRQSELVRLLANFSVVIPRK